VTCHDGFTLNDLVSYNEKHNLANGANNQDGTDANWSWNCGAEGPTNDAAINALRARQCKNFAAILLFSHGVPMILSGDEMGRTQQGNNNAYCQDNEVSWMDWNLARGNADLLRFVQRMIAFRKRCPLLRRDTFELDGDTGFHVTWHGKKRMAADWSSECRSIATHWTQTYRDGSRDDLHFIAHAHWQDGRFELPNIAPRKWFRFVDTALASPEDIADESLEFALRTQNSYNVKARSVVIFVAK